MATRASKITLTPEAYIALERGAEQSSEIARSEYIAGEIIAMSGASFVHNLIGTNISGELRNRLRGSGYTVFANDMRIGVLKTASYFYPDVGVICGTPHCEDNVFDTLLNPQIIVEILSPSTELYDRGEKFAHYRLLDSLQEYVLVSQDKVCVERYLRHASGWILTDFRELAQPLPLRSVQCELPLQEIYENVVFSA